LTAPVDGWGLLWGKNWGDEIASSAKRKNMANIMDYLLANKNTIHYREFRPMDWTSWTWLGMRMRLKARRSVYADCSESTTAICKWAGLSDPNGNNYNGWGNTDSMYSNLRHYKDPSNALVGALVVFGSYPGTKHVAMVRYPDPHDPKLWSHGHEGSPDDPALYNFSSMSAYFNNVYTFCSVANL
jgi:hypothetical protein